MGRENSYRCRENAEHSDAGDSYLDYYQLTDPVITK